MEAIWSHEQAEFHGEFVDFEPTWSWPKPVQQPRVRTLIGGGGTEAVFAAIADVGRRMDPDRRPWAGRGPPPPARPARGGRARPTATERGALRHHRRRGQARALRRARGQRGGAAHPGRRQPPRCGRSSRRSPPSSRSRPHWSSHDRPHRRHDPSPRQHDAVAQDHQRGRPHRGAGPPLADLAARTLPRPGPQVERRGIGEMEHIGGGTYRQTFDPDGPPADCWVYEDLVYINKRHVAAVGFDRDDMTMSPITYDEMRPGCYEPKARMADKDVNWVEASLCFPTFPRFCGQTFLEAKDRELAEACVVAYNDWMVEEWCGDSGGQAAPALPHPAVGRRAGRGRGAPQRRARRARGVLQRDPAPPGAAQHPRRLLGPVLRRLRGDRHGGLHAHRLVLEDAGHLGRRAGRGGRHAELRQRHGVADRLPLLGRPGPLPRAAARLLRGPDRLAALHPRAGRRRLARAPGLGRA